MIIEHQGKQPTIHKTAYIAPNATVYGNVVIGANTCVLFGAIISAEGDQVEIGSNCVVMENAVIRGTPKHPVRIGSNVLVGPHAHLTGCRVDDNAFLATGCSIFTSAHIGSGAEVRINGVVHLKTVLPPNETVPIGWVAVGDPARIFPPDEHNSIWEIQKPLDFPKTVFGVERSLPGETNMPEIMERYTRTIKKQHRDDITVNE